MIFLLIDLQFFMRKFRVGIRFFLWCMYTLFFCFSRFLSGCHFMKFLFWPLIYEKFWPDRLDDTWLDWSWLLVIFCTILTSKLWRVSHRNCRNIGILGWVSRAHRFIQSFSYSHNRLRSDQITLLMVRHLDLRKIAPLYFYGSFENSAP